MAKDKRQKEDNRDIFEKALDYAPAAVGAVIGGTILRRSSPKYTKARDLKARMDEMTPAERARFDHKAYDAAEGARQAMDRRFRNLNTAVGATSGAAAGGMVGGIYEREKRRKRK